MVRDYKNDMLYFRPKLFKFFTFILQSEGVLHLMGGSSTGSVIVLATPASTILDFRVGPLIEKQHFVLWAYNPAPIFSLQLGPTPTICVFFITITWSPLSPIQPMQPT